MNLQMDKTEFLALVNSEFPSGTAGAITPAKLRNVFTQLATYVYDSIAAKVHTEARVVALTADTPTDVYFETAFADTDYALACMAKKADGTYINVTLVKHTGYFTVTAAFDVTLDFVASVQTEIPV
jgi:hypothetical protein